MTLIAERYVRNRLTSNQTIIADDPLQKEFEAAIAYATIA